MKPSLRPSTIASVLPPALARSDLERLRELLRESSERSASSSFVIEGPHLLERAIEVNASLVLEVYCTAEALKKNSALVLKLERKKIAYATLSAKQAEQLSDTKSPQGIVARVAIPNVKPSQDRCVLVLDGVQDPGNVGTIIRAAAWFGVSHIILSMTSADPYSPKTVRATQGEIFSLRCERVTDVVEALKQQKKTGHKIFTTTLEHSACSIYRERFDGKFALVLGSEAHGVSEAVMALSDRSLVIEKIGNGESLNVAMSAVIILSEIAARSKRV